MQQPLMLIVILLAILVASCRSQDCSGNQPRPQQVAFKKLLHLDGVVLKRHDHVLSQAWVTSNIDCSRRCAGSEGCAVFTFQPGQEHASPGGSCQLYGQLPNATMDREASPGARSYAKYDDLPCDAGYSWLCSGCLKFVPTKMKFDDARKHCRDLNWGRLLVVRTLEELDCAVSVMKSHGVESDAQMWVGANDLAESGRYVWEDCSALAVDSELWAADQPNNGMEKENCMGVNSKDRGLRDLLCNYVYYAMCQRDP